MKFPLGPIFFTQNVDSLMSNDVFFARFVIDSLIRHGNGDWGSENRVNELATRRYAKIYSTFKKEDFPEILILTEADHSGTTVKFPDEGDRFL